MQNSLNVHSSVKTQQFFLAHVDNDFTNLTRKLNHLSLPTTSDELDEREFQVIMTKTLTFSQSDY